MSTTDSTVDRPSDHASNDDAPRDDAPIVATMIGDPAGVGPEVCVKALAQPGHEPGSPRSLGRHLLVGSAEVVKAAAACSGVTDEIRTITALDQAAFAPGIIDVLDPDPLPAGAVAFGEPSATCGHAVIDWLNRADGLAQSGQVQAWIMAPVDSTSLQLAKVADSIDDLQPEGTTMFRVSGNLRVAALSEHIPISQVPADVTTDHILEVLRLVNRCLNGWGVPHVRFAVAGLNPHAMGVEDDNEIRPAVAQAQAEGLDVTGPISPDSVFRQCLLGDYDVVLSMYHDQGQIPLKTAAFEGACTLYLGLPFLRLTIPHGSAYDIAGQGIAQSRSMAAAMATAASLAAGRGFPQFGKPRRTEGAAS